MLWEVSSGGAGWQYANTKLADNWITYESTNIDSERTCCGCGYHYHDIHLGFPKADGGTPDTARAALFYKGIAYQSSFLEAYNLVTGEFVTTFQLILYMILLQASALKKFIPMFDRILVERFAAETTTKGGIMIPEKAIGKVHSATVVAVGQGARTNVIFCFAKQYFIWTVLCTELFMSF